MLLIPLFPRVPELSVVIYVVKNASYPVSGELSPETGQEAFLVSSGRIVTLGTGLCKLFLRRKRLTTCGAIDKEEGGSSMQSVDI